MDTILGWTDKMNLRTKLALIYTAAFTLVLGVTFVFIYIISEKYRREDAYGRLSDRARSTFKISIQVDQISNNLLKVFDKNTVNSLTEEQILLFDSSGRELYCSRDSGYAVNTENILANLKESDGYYEGTEGKYDVIAMKFVYKNHTYYGIASGFDKFGIRKVHFLAFVLTFTFASVTLLIVLLSFYLSSIITRPITELAKHIEQISPDDLSKRVEISASNYEIGVLSTKFNELLEKVENAFKFQYHYIHHISHELKTPLAIMIANAERAIADNEKEAMKSSLHFQVNATMEVSQIINALLDISKMEKKLVSRDHAIRVDEVIFECLDDITLLNANVRFDFIMHESLDEKRLTVLGSGSMIKMAIMNLIKNAINFSVHENPSIEINTEKKEVLIKITNDGPVLHKEEQQLLFVHSFRGSNSHLVRGFGMGLVLAYRIVNVLGGKLTYLVNDKGRNCFILRLPLASQTTN